MRRIRSAEIGRPAAVALLEAGRPAAADRVDERCSMPHFVRRQQGRFREAAWRWMEGALGPPAARPAVPPEPPGASASPGREPGPQRRPRPAERRDARLVVLRAGAGVGADGRGGDQESATPDGALRCRPTPE